MTKRKQPVTLTLDADVVARARMFTDNLSTFVESLLADYIAREQRCRITDANVMRETVATWNRFAEKHGSFADEHSAL